MNVYEFVFSRFSGMLDIFLRINYSGAIASLFGTFFVRF